MYSSGFYARREARVAASAAALVPRLVELLAPRSVIDIGCANGLWLAAFARSGVTQLRGVDGPWVPREALRMAAAAFATHDLTRCALPYQLAGSGERFDMLLCLELLEHLPAQRADALVDALCALSDTLVVSAAVPHQGGTGHVNEQWPGYWRQRFAARGFVACDFLRIACWDDERIAPWYRQNIVGYFRGSVPTHIHAFATAQVQRLVDEPMALCHPGVFSYKLGKLRNTLRHPLRAGMAQLRRYWGSGAQA
jgi:SAM-dependent methyltransferase